MATRKSDMKENYLPFVSVIIPVFNNAEGLKLCIDSLKLQSYDQNRFEVIVIDNGSEDFAQVKSLVETWDVVTLATEKTPGSYAARNRGLAIAKGEIIAFTDSDCLPTRDWLQTGVSHLQTVDNCGEVVGKVELFFVNQQHPTLVDIYERLTALKQDKMLHRLKGGATANVFTWKRVIDEVGPFNSSLKSSGDLEWGRRVYAAGYTQYYAEDAVVRHPTRSTFQELRKRSIRISGGGYGLCMHPDDSFIQKQKMFGRLILDEFVQAGKFVFSLFQNPEVSEFSIKWRLILL
ncbi:MAG: glycosyltransferase family 2 protein, partial [Cyanobacteriota bacterium]|nr:glycosyltransferase family 2 protein [Cyanobacteriota bacterium]